MKRSSVFHNEILQVGSKCLVTINGNPDHQYPAYIQDMQPDKGPVCVFVEVLGERYASCWYKPIKLSKKSSNNSVTLPKAAK